MPRPDNPRLLIVPGLRDSGPAHWQSWLQGLYRSSVRVQQHDWDTPDLERWSARITSTLARSGAGPWIAVGHSFGCLALAHHLGGQSDSPIQAALLVAPADPDRFGLAEAFAPGRLRVMSTVIASQTDPWITTASARRWAAHWGSQWISLGDAGHINAESGFGPLPLARRWVLAVEQRLARERRPALAAFSEWRIAV
jgi:hypothetical protein